jgi:hypothetical protein
MLRGASTRSPGARDWKSAAPRLPDANNIAAAAPSSDAISASAWS